MFSFLLKPIQPYLTEVKIAIGISLLCGLLVVSYLYKTQIEKTAVVETQLTTLQQTYEQTQKALKDEQVKHIQLSHEREQVYQDYIDMKRKLDGFKNRENVVVKKPGLVQIKIQKSFDGFMNELYCNTGDLRQCPKK
jgi:predicted nuclease with TOPRIM domain